MKPWYKSKTILFNLLATVAAFLTTAIEPLRPMMTPEVFAYFSLAVGVINVVLRYVTSQPMMMSDSESDERR